MLEQLAQAWTAALEEVIRLSHAIAGYWTADRSELTCTQVDQYHTHAGPAMEASARRQRTGVQRTFSSWYAPSTISGGR